MKECPTTGAKVLDERYIRREINLTVTIMEAFHCYIRHTKFEENHCKRLRPYTEKSLMDAKMTSKLNGLRGDGFVWIR